MSRLPEVTDRSFEAMVLRSKVPVLVDFQASWCPPCRVLAPVLGEFARETPGLRVVSFDAGLAPEFASAQGITALPTLVIYRDGREVARWTGSAPKREIARFVSSALEENR
jgi:thioredoxin 1